MALSGLKLFTNEADFMSDNAAYKLGLYTCELEVNDEKDVGYAKNGKPLTTFVKRTYKVQIKSLPFLMPSNFVNNLSIGYNTIESLYNKQTKEELANMPEYSKMGLYSYMRSRRLYHSIQGVFPTAYGDFEGTYKTINSTENQNYGIIEGTIHCLPSPRLYRLKLKEFNDSVL